MNKKQLIVAWEALPFLVSLLLLISPYFSYAGNLEPTENIEEVRQKAPELIIHEEDLTYDEYKDSLKSLEETLNKYKEGKGNELGWEIENIGISNWLLTIEGYGFKRERDIIRLELENAKLRGATKGEIADLKSKLKEAEKRLKDFLTSNIWVD